eukprot:CAMPEP_0174757236 /NCGR_PEP_ID=MMETSP1094-20130205/107161_1 /TAXON_ID=156173 /ORGANISM="Chrysochromulina brevifilum, Strain UTEX LB 985" /LENGTH=94 /DNA_ID=CAMNT_0015963153 /DNA_START=130 /DNA_END=415 /DNA_ORIENTATION=+
MNASGVGMTEGDVVALHHRRAACPATKEVDDNVVDADGGNARCPHRADGVALVDKSRRCSDPEVCEPLVMECKSSLLAVWVPCWTGSKRKSSGI